MGPGCEKRVRVYGLLGHDGDTGMPDWTVLPGFIGPPGVEYSLATSRPDPPNLARFQKATSDCKPEVELSASRRVKKRKKRTRRPDGYFHASSTARQRNYFLQWLFLDGFTLRTLERTCGTDPNGSPPERRTVRQYLGQRSAWLMPMHPIQTSYRTEIPTINSRKAL